MLKVLLTGATGFVGSKIAFELNKSQESKLVVALRKEEATLSSQSFVVGNIDGETNYSTAIAGVNVVIHAAARAHIMRDEVADPLAEYRRVNVDGTMNLARQALAAGVKRFIYISSIKVNGESTSSGFPLDRKSVV